MQRQATSFALSDYDCSNSVTAILSKLNWTIWDKRRRIARLAMFYKIIKDSVALPAWYRLAQ